MIQIFRDFRIQGLKDVQKQGFRELGICANWELIEGFIELGIWGLRDMGIQGFRDLRIQGFKDLGIWGLRDLKTKIYMELGMWGFGD